MKIYTTKSAEIDTPESTNNFGFINAHDLERQQLTLDGILSRFWCSLERGEPIEIHWQ